MGWEVRETFRALRSYDASLIPGQRGKEGRVVGWFSEGSAVSSKLAKSNGETLRPTHPSEESHASCLSISAALSHWLGPASGNYDEELPSRTVSQFVSLWSEIDKVHFLGSLKIEGMIWSPTCQALTIQLIGLRNLGLKRTLTSV